jgi:hypothetical protein
MKELMISDIDLDESNYDRSLMNFNNQRSVRGILVIDCLHHNPNAILKNTGILSI